MLKIFYSVQTPIDIDSICDATAGYVVEIRVIPSGLLEFEFPSPPSDALVQRLDAIMTDLGATRSQAG